MREHIRRTIAVAAEVRYEAVTPGRLLRVRFPLGDTYRMPNVLCAYQHAWVPKEPQTLDKRQGFWHHLNRCIADVPHRELLVGGGDLKVQLTPRTPM